MKIKYLAIIAVSLMTMRLTAENYKTLSFYGVRKIAKAPVVNGILDDPVWKKTPSYSDYYVYFKPEAIPSPLKTSFQMVYDEKGIYLAIINYENHLDKLKANFTTRDNPKLWTDDCAEIYFDTTGTAIGFTKFVVNSIGTVSDMKRIDTAITLADWSGAGWRCATSKTNDAWIVEAFFPWSDLGGVAKTGAVWRFCSVRYAFTSGKFQGCSSSPGGAYTFPQHFGYISFLSGKKQADKALIGGLLSKSATPPWRLPLKNGFLQDDGTGARFVTYLNLLSQENKRYTSLIEELNNLPLSPKEKTHACGLRAKTPKDSEVGNMSSGDLRRLIEDYAKINTDLENLKWEAKAVALVDNVSAASK